jgi:predicted peroxiredoxin
VNISFINNPPPASAGMIFAPYVDCTLWPNFEIQNTSVSGIYLYTCAFIVDDQFAAGANPCWGGYSTLQMDYYQDKILALRSQGGDIIMSFGGANGIELAYAAADEFLARDAYKTVIDAYSLTSIDFDIEGFLAADAASVLRRSKAMKLLQNEYPGLKISLTLACLPTGLTNDGLNVVQSAINQNVDISCVNLMAMDYGPATIDMGDAAISAAQALFTQLHTMYQNSGVVIADSLIWRKIGITPMIGQNDVQGEIFNLNDASDVANWAAQNHIGRLSLWSANRDRQCANATDPLYSCSHIQQELFEFSGIFGNVAPYPVLSHGGAVQSKSKK